MRPLRWSSVRTLRAASRSITATTLLQGVVLWLWHAPALFDLTLRHEWVHRAEHLSFLLAALLFWRALLRAPPRDAGHGLLWLLITLIHGGMLGALITLAPRPL